VISNNFYEYMSAANPLLPEIPIKGFGLELLDNNFGWIPFDLSKELQTPYIATSPSLLAGYIHLKPNQVFEFKPNSAAVFGCVLQGAGTCQVNNETFNIALNDVLSLPGCLPITFTTKSEELVLYCVNDAPLLNRLHAKPDTSSPLVPLLYKSEDIFAKIEEIDAESANADRNRDAIIYGHQDVFIGKGMTPSVWAATVKVNVGEEALAHRHNSVAIDIVIDCAEGAYSCLGWKLDKFNQIIDPIIVPWKKGSAFVTPPGIWHSHHNKSNKPAFVTAVQDATLHEYLRTLDIQFTHRRIENRI